MLKQQIKATCWKQQVERLLSTSRTFYWHCCHFWQQN